jgi:hypothetical protein
VTRSKRKPEVKRAGGGAGRSIRAHRLFPAFTALWFAALFALASLVVPVAVIQSAVVALGLPKIVASAAPPLGFTARVLVTLALVGLGGLLGLVVGLRLGTRKAVPADEAPVTFGRRKSGAAELAALVEEDEQGRIAEQPLVAGDPAHQDEAPLEAPLPVVSDLAGSAPVVPDAPFDAPVAAPAAPRVRARDAHPDAPPRRPLTVSDDMIDEAETRILSDDEEASRRPSREGRLFDPFAIYEDEAGQDEPFVPPAFLARAFDRADLPAEPAVPVQAPVIAADEPVDVVAPEPEPATLAPSATESAEVVEENDGDSTVPRIRPRWWLRSLRAPVWPRRWPRPILTGWVWSSWSNVWRWPSPATARIAMVCAWTGARMDGERPFLPLPNLPLLNLDAPFRPWLLSCSPMS